MRASGRRHPADPEPQPRLGRLHPAAGALTATSLHFRYRPSQRACVGQIARLRRRWPADLCAWSAQESEAVIATEAERREWPVGEVAKVRDPGAIQVRDPSAIRARSKCAINVGCPKNSGSDVLDASLSHRDPLQNFNNVLASFALTTVHIAYANAFDRQHAENSFPVLP